MVFAQITWMPPHVVIPIVIFFYLAGMVLQGYGTFGLIILMAFAALGYLIKKYDYSFVSFLLAFIITPMLELNLRQSIILSRGNWEILPGRPIAVFFIACTLLALVMLEIRSFPPPARPPPGRLRPSDPCAGEGRGTEFVATRCLRRCSKTEPPSARTGVRGNQKTHDRQESSI